MKKKCMTALCLVLALIVSCCVLPSRAVDSRPTAQEIARALDEAASFDGTWWGGTPWDLFDDNDYFQGKDQYEHYYRVKGYHSIAEVAEIGKRNLSNSVIDNFLLSAKSDSKYVERDGKLYVSDAGGIGSLMDHVELYIQADSPTRYTVRVKEIWAWASDEDDGATHTVHYQYEDGRWAFTNYICYEWYDPVVVTFNDLRNIAYSSNQAVKIDGIPVNFQMYALKDANGGSTNYIKVRDLAVALNGTPAQFAVSWNGTVDLLPGKPYVVSGSEGQPPFTGNWPYTKLTASTNVSGSSASLDGIVLNDFSGGGYTYYKLRDLGQFLDFNVGWRAEEGIYVETDRKYDPNN